MFLKGFLFCDSLCLRYLCTIKSEDRLHLGDLGQSLLRVACAVFTPQFHIYTTFVLKLHIFNPEHEMALAVNKNKFTLPHNIQEFRMNMGFLPALWASDGDCVLVDDVAYAVKALAGTGLPHADVLFLSDAGLKDLSFSGVDAWGWDKAVRRRLAVGGVPLGIMPDDDELNSIRSMAHRRLTTDVLMAVCEGLGQAACGKSFYITDVRSVARLIASYGNVVLKAPWSSSGHGVRYASSVENKNTMSWAANVISRQGGIMVEPHYNCIMNFAMEFVSDGLGGIDCCGLSVFHTEHGNYAGNIIAAEDEKRRIVERYIGAETLCYVHDRMLEGFSKILKRRYRGCFGVDMMVVADPDSKRFKIHPCVEINFRRTMGHVANSFKVSPDEPVRFMRIAHNVNYTLRVITPDKGFVKVL